MKVILVKERVFLVVLMMNFKVYLMSVNFYGIYKDDDIVDFYIKCKGKFISLNDFDWFDVYYIFCCDGLLLCIINGEEKINKFKFVIWNFYCG